MRETFKLIDTSTLSVKPEDTKNPGRKTDEAYGREGHKYLVPDQVAALIKSARRNRNGLRDALMISMAFHHGLRAIELVSLRWSDINFKANGQHQPAQERPIESPTARSGRPAESQGALPRS